MFYQPENGTTLTKDDEQKNKLRFIIMITSNDHTVEQKSVTDFAFKLGICFGFKILPGFE